MYSWTFRSRLIDQSTQTNLKFCQFCPHFLFFQGAFIKIFENFKAKVHIAFKNGFSNQVKIQNFQLWSYDTTKFLWKKEMSVSNFIAQSLMIRPKVIWSKCTNRNLFLCFAACHQFSNYNMRVSLEGWAC